jgi:2-oxoglutarate dehydrogenase E2 component (dihydrolipoamide succinyltransferase)
MTSSRTEEVATVDVTMPQMGVSVAEGTVVQWRKQVGDWVQADETICEISTDKIDTEVPSPASGRVAEILVQVEETVPVGAVLARLITGAPAAATPTASGSEPNEAPTSEIPSDAPGRAPSKRHYSPVVQRIAAAHGIDLEAVAGTGREGRVRKQDVLAAAATATGNGARATQSARSAPEPAPQPPLHTESPYRPESAEPPGVRGSHDATPPSDSSEPLSRMRRSIGEHMLRSLRTAAHCTTIVEADFVQIERARHRLGLTYLPLVARCVIDALREFPKINATLDGHTLTRHHDVNLGIAVSLGEDGLIVPVIHRAQELSAEGLGHKIAELGRRAREGQLTNDDVAGGTFTITNPGAFGAIAATPIINQPQVAILDLEAVVKRPVVVVDEAGQEAIAIRPMANLCLSWDHRALDGALAAQFLSAVRRRIESWTED